MRRVQTMSRIRISKWPRKRAFVPPAIRDYCHLLSWSLYVSVDSQTRRSRAPNEAICGDRGEAMGHAPVSASATAPLGSRGGGPALLRPFLSACHYWHSSSARSLHFQQTTTIETFSRVARLNGVATQRHSTPADFCNSKSRKTKSGSFPEKPQLTPSRADL